MTEPELIATIILLLNAGHEADGERHQQRRAGAAASALGVDEARRGGNAARRAAAAVQNRGPRIAALRYAGAAVRALVLTDTVVNGTELAAGTQVALLDASGNRDAAKFSRPDELDLRRSPNSRLDVRAGHSRASAHHWRAWRCKIALHGLVRRPPRAAAGGRGGGFDLRQRFRHSQSRAAAGSRRGVYPAVPKTPATIVAIATYVIVSGIFTQSGVILGPAAAYFHTSVPDTALMFSYLNAGNLGGIMLCLVVFPALTIRQVLASAYGVFFAGVALLETTPSLHAAFAAVVLIGFGVGTGLSTGAVIISKLFCDWRRAIAFLGTDCAFSAAGWTGFPAGRAGDRGRLALAERISFGGGIAGRLAPGLAADRLSPRVARCPASRRAAGGDAFGLPAGGAVRRGAAGILDR